MFHDQSWKLIYFSSQKIKVKGRNASPSNCACRCISACTAWHRSTSLSFVCQSRTSLVAANSALQAEDFYTFLVTTCQTTADARFRTLVLTAGTYLLKMCGNRHLWPSLNGIAEFAGLENDGVEQEQTYILHMKKNLMCTTCNCLSTNLTTYIVPHLHAVDIHN